MEHLQIQTTWSSCHDATLPGSQDYVETSWKPTLEMNNAIAESVEKGKKREQPDHYSEREEERDHPDTNIPEGGSVVI